METSELFLPTLVLGIAVVMLVLGLSNRVIAKLGLRNFFRHRGHAAVSIVGLLVGTSIICASMVVGDSIEYFIVQDTYNDLDLVDIVVSGELGASFSIDAYERLSTDRNLAELTDAVSPLFAGKVTVINTATGRFEPSVNLIGFDAVIDRGFGDFVLADGRGVDGSDIGSHGIIINEELAEDINANIGDVLNVTYTFGRPGIGGNVGNVQFAVKYIAADQGKARYAPRTMTGSNNFNMFVDIGTAQEMFRQPDMITHIKISNNGGVMDGAYLSDDVVRVVEPILEGLRYTAEDTFTFTNQTYIKLSNTGIIGDTFSLTVNDAEADEGAYSFESASGNVTILDQLNPGDIIKASYQYTYSLEINPVKQRGLDSARMFNDVVSTFLTIFGSFAIIAGVILIINIFTMLAEERKSELGMVRAVGMKRRHLMQSFLFEGLAYGCIASAMGVLVGLCVGYVLIHFVNEFVTFLDITIPFHFKMFSLAKAFSLGFIITFGTILLTSWKISKINIIQAIRGIEETARGRRGTLMIPTGCLLLAASAAVYLNFPDEALAILLGPPGMLTGLVMALWRWTGNRASVIAASLGVFLYTFYAIRTSLREMGSENIDLIFILSGIMIVLSIVLLIMYNSGPVILAITGTFGRVRKFRPTVMTAVSYPLIKKFRTGMSVAMFALVIYMIVMLSVFSGMFATDIERDVLKQGGGFDIKAEFNQYYTMDITNVTFQGIPIRSDALANITRITQFSREYAPEVNVTDGATEGSDMFGFGIGMGFGSVIYGIDHDFHDNSTFEFSKKLDGYADDRAIWSAVTEDGSDKIVVNTFTGMVLQVEPGNHVIFTTRSGNLTREFQVIAIMDQNILPGTFMSRQNAIEGFGPGAMFNTAFLFELRAGMDPKATADALERDFAALGMNAVIVRDEVELSMHTTNSLFVLFELYLDMGLVVGVAGLGIITIRSVVERTPEIGILRSLGFKRSNVRNAFLLEILFVASLGVLIGVFTGIMVSYEIFNIVIKDYAQNIEFTVPWLKIAYVTAIAYLATILCTIIPARNASKIAPAEALRYVG